MSLILTPDISRSHEEAFCKYHQWLVRRALQFTGKDHEKAEELVQEVFAQLLFARTDLSAVQNLPAYLYSTLHNTYVSQVRMEARNHTQSLSVIEYNCTDAALQVSNPSSAYQVQDELHRICQYACARKESSRAGSALILRFFYGYHISEVAKIFGSTSQAVRQCLRFARNEVRLFLENPAALGFIDQVQLSNFTSYGHGRTAEELLSDIRGAVFRSYQGDCLSIDSLRVFYAVNVPRRLSNSVIAHVVSCRGCLDTVNEVLGLPLLADRFGEDIGGADNR